VHKALHEQNTLLKPTLDEWLRSLAVVDNCEVRSRSSPAVTGGCEVWLRGALWLVCEDDKERVVCEDDEGRVVCEDDEGWESDAGASAASASSAVLFFGESFFLERRMVEKREKYKPKKTN